MEKIFLENSTKGLLRNSLFVIASDSEAIFNLLKNKGLLRPPTLRRGPRNDTIKAFCNSPTKGNLKNHLLRVNFLVCLFLLMPVASYSDSDKIEGASSSLDTPEINYNRGVINYRKNDFEKAAGLFNRALISHDKNLEAKASYNLGNCEYKIGKSKEKENLAQTVKLLREALQYYKRSIELDEKNNDAKFNYERVEKELKVLEEKLKQQKGQSENKEQKGEEKNQEEQSAQAQQEKEQKEMQQESQARESSQKKKERSEKEEQAQEAAEPKEMSKEEAKIMLEGYRQEENALGEVKEKRRAQSGEVLKDW